MFKSVDKNTLTLKLDKMFYVLFRLMLHYKKLFSAIFRPTNSDVRQAVTYKSPSLCSEITSSRLCCQLLNSFSNSSSK